MKKIKILKGGPLLLSLYLIFSLSGCGNKPVEEPEQPPIQTISEVQRVSEEQKPSEENKAKASETSFDLSSRAIASRIYALDMFKQFNIYNNETTPEKNLIISPLSIEYIMGMLMAGADEQTSEKIADALHLSGVSSDDLNKVLSENMKFHTQKASDDSNSKLLLANGIFVLEKSTVNPAYQQQMKDLYQANIQSVKENDAKLINGWIGKQTQGRIKKVVDDPVSDTTLINTVYFKGKWPDEFFDKKRTEKRLFKGIKTQKLMPTMYQGGLSRYYEDSNVQALYQSYKGGDYAILLLLPKEQTEKDLDTFISRLDEPYFTQILDGSRSPKKDYLGELYLPKFETEYKNDKLLENSQRLLGIDLKTSLFSNIVNANLVISRMLQIANIKLDEEGTEAAAVTVVEMTKGTAAPNFKEKPEPIPFIMDINHPFAYAILDKEGSIVFIGTVKDIH